jgi:hypothetical protein
MNPGYFGWNHYDDMAAQVAAFGSKAVETCTRMLHYSEEFDHHRKRQAIRALGLIGNEDSLVPLLAAIPVEKDWGHIREMVLAVLKIYPSIENADWVSETMVKDGRISQDYIIRQISQSSIPAEIKLRIYRRIDSFNMGGHTAVVKALVAMVENPTAFELLKQEAFKHHYATFGVAVRELAKLEKPDPRPVLLELLKDVLDRNKLPSVELIIAVGTARCKQAMPLLEKKFTELSKESADHRRRRVVIAGVFCHFNYKYATYSAFVKEALTDKQYASTAYKVAGWLYDEDSISLITGAFCQMPVDGDWVNHAAANAVAEIAFQTGDAKTRELAEKMKATAIYIRYTVDPSGNVKLDEAAREKSFEGAASFIGEHPKLGVNFIERHASYRLGLFGDRPFIKLIEKTWHDSYVKSLEELVKTSTYKNAYDGDHYTLRRLAAALLTKKTGKKYTYVDVDGEVHKPGE